jgi:flagellar assembly protein FliH
MSEGKLEGLLEGMSEGKLEGLLEGMSEGKEEGWSEGKEEGWSEGKLDGRADGSRALPLEPLEPLALLLGDFLEVPRPRSSRVSFGR